MNLAVLVAIVCSNQLLNCHESRAYESYNKASQLFERINVMSLHESNIHGAGIKVALIDEGFDIRPEFLQNNFLQAQRKYE